MPLAGGQAERLNDEPRSFTGWRGTPVQRLAGLWQLHEMQHAMKTKTHQPSKTSKSKPKDGQTLLQSRPSLAFGGELKQAAKVLVELEQRIRKEIREARRQEVRLLDSHCYMAATARHGYRSALVNLRYWLTSRLSEAPSQTTRNPVRGASRKRAPKASAAGSADCTPSVNGGDER